MTITGNIVDVLNRKIFFGTITVKDERIQQIERREGSGDRYILPGFIDAHVHVESSMLVPTEFARLAVVHGTVATVSDPHEIANVLGVDGVHYMIENGKQSPFKFFFGAPSCVPATSFESAGATIDADAVRALLANPDIWYLSEMMNYPGVLMQDEEVLAKIAHAQKIGKPVDGHAPGLRGEDARRYIDAGISTDHECVQIAEAVDKLTFGMHIAIREGSAAKNFEALIPLLPEYTDRIMFCSDDKHPDDLIVGHINQLASRAVQKGYELFDVLQAACVNPVRHYDLPVGLLRPGDPADFIIVEDLRDFNVEATYIHGALVAENGVSRIPRVEAAIVNNFHATPKAPQDFKLPAASQRVQVIRASDGALITERFTTKIPVTNGTAQPDIRRDILKMTVVNRYTDAPPALAFIHGFGLRRGAIASCVGHDSHNIIAVGTDDEDLCRAVNAVIAHQGGIAAVAGDQVLVLPLPVAGIMTHEDGYVVAKKYAEIDKFVKNELGSQLSAPFMTLSFMALLVIPELKLSDKGLFDGKAFQFADLFV
jgi:adenine deaminase